MSCILLLSSIEFSEYRYRKEVSVRVAILVLFFANYFAIRLQKIHISHCTKSHFTLVRGVISILEMSISYLCSSNY